MGLEYPRAPAAVDAVGSDRRVAILVDAHSGLGVGVDVIVFEEAARSLVHPHPTHLMVMDPVATHLVSQRVSTLSDPSERVRQ